MTEEERFAIEKDAIKGILQAFILLTGLGVQVGLPHYLMLLSKLEVATRIEDLIPSEKDSLDNIDPSKLDLDEEFKKNFGTGE